MERLFCTILLFIGLSCLVKAQDPLYWQLTDEDGLPSNTLYNIAQDSLGYIWLGTANGICRYDGYRFKSFSHPEMLDNEIFNIQIDQKNNVWFNNLSGQIFKIENDSCGLFFDCREVDDKSLTSFHIAENYVIIGLLDNQIGEEGTLLMRRLDSAGNGVKDKTIELPKVYYRTYNGSYSPGRNSQEMAIIFLDHRENVPSSPFDLYKIDVPLDSIEKLAFDFSKNHLQIKEKKGKFSFYLPQKQNEFFVYYHSTLEVYEQHNGNITKSYKHNFDGRINYIIPFQSYSVLLFERGFRFFKKEEFSDLNLSSFEINHGMEDREGNLWLLTNRSGILVIPNIENKFIQKVSVTSLDKINDDEIAVGFEKGNIGLLNKEKFEAFSLNSSNTISVIKKLDPDKDQYMVGTNLEIQLFEKSQPESSKNIFPYNYAVKDFLINEDTFYLGNYNSFRKIPFKLENDLVKIRYAKPELLQRTYKLFLGPQNEIYLGTYLGVYVYQKGKISKITFESGTDFFGNVSNFVYDPEGNLWVSSNGNGIHKISNQKIVYSLADAFPELPSNCKDFDIDEQGRFWIGTPKGLYMLNPQNNTQLIFNKSNGLPTNEINHVKYFNGKTFLGTELGLISLDMETTIAKNIAPKIYYADVNLLGGKSIKQGSELSHDENFLNFNFTGLSFISKDGISYEYRLLGLDSNWVETKSNLVQMPGLSPGEYTFQVISKNANGVKSENPKNFNFSILPPWYKTWWFYLLSATIIFGLIYLYFHNRHQNFKKREALKLEFSEKVNKLRMEALQTQMNPHFIFNAMNAIQHYLTESDGENAMKYLAKFARLIRLIFEQSKEQEIALEDEIELIELYLELEKLRFGDNVSTKLEIDESIRNLDDYINLPPLVVQPMIENAFRHGLFHKKGKGYLTVRFDIHNNYLRCTIEDNGIGLTASKALKKDLGVKSYRSSGINSTKERLAIHHNITIEQLEYSNLFSLKEVEREGEIGTEVVIHFKLFGKK